MESIDIKSLLSTVSIESCPNIINLHTHTIYSDGSLEPKALIDQAIDLKLEHIAITDHHTVKGFLIAKNYLETVNSNLRLWTGLEISCTLKGCLVHILALDFEISNSSLKPYQVEESTIGRMLTAEVVIDSIHEAGGLAILAHPARYRKPFQELIDEAYRLGIDGAEVWYDYDFSAKWQPSIFICTSVAKHLDKYKLLHSCGTDTHGLDLSRR